MKKKDIKTYNNKGQRHGYWEVYVDNGDLWIKCVYVNNNINGVFESYWEGKLSTKNYHL